MTNPVDPNTGLTEEKPQALPKLDLSKYVNKGQLYTPSSGPTITGNMMRTPEFITNFN